MQGGEAIGQWGKLHSVPFCNMGAQSAPFNGECVLDHNCHCQPLVFLPWARQYSMLQHSIKVTTNLNPYPTPLQPLTIRRYEVNGNE